MNNDVQNSNLKIGIDVSFESCGIVVIDAQDNIVFTKIHRFKDRELTYQTYLECSSAVDTTLKELTPALTNKQLNYFDIYLETSSHGNSLIMQKFCGLTTMLMATFISKIDQLKNKPGKIKEIRIVNSTEWFGILLKEHNIPYKLGEWTRDKKKGLSKQLSKIGIDDLSDAYWIAKYGNRCKNLF